MSFIMSKDVEHSSEKTPRELIGRFIKFRYFSFLRTALLLRLDSKLTVDSRTYRHWTGLGKENLDDNFHQLLLRDSENHRVKSEH